jgi:hypothetical protein
VSTTTTRKRAAPAEPPSLLTRSRRLWDDVAHGRFTCSCCPGKEFRSVRAWNANHLARHGVYWGSKAAGTTGRKMGKAQDAARRHARGWREAAGLSRTARVPIRDEDGKDTGRTRQVSVPTGRARSRPALRGVVRIRELRRVHRHDRDHERADSHERRAVRHMARGNHEAVLKRVAAANRLRGRWPERDPEPRETPAPRAPRTRS